MIFEYYHLKQILLSIEDLQNVDIANKDNHIIRDIDVIIKAIRRHFMQTVCTLLSAHYENILSMCYVVL